MNKYVGRYQSVHCTVCGWEGKRKYQKYASFNCPRCADADVVGNVIPSKSFDHVDNPDAGKCASEEEAKIVKKLNVALLEHRLGIKLS